MSTVDTRPASPHVARRGVPVPLRIAALATAGLALTACAASSSGSASEASAVPSAAAVGGAAAGLPAAEGDALGAGAGSGTANGTSTTSGSVDSAKTATGSGLGTVVDRSIVVHADTTVRVDDVDAATARLGVMAVGHHATIATQATTNGTTPVPSDPASPSAAKSACGSNGCVSGYASSVTVLRVANSGVDALLHDVAALGDVEASARTSDDVTADVADTDARVANARASLARVRVLMSRATSLAQIVTIEGELSRREADLEALEARQRTLADQTAQATVTVTLLSRQAPAAVTAEEDTGFLAGLRQGWKAFTAALVAGLTVLGALVPFLVVLVPLALLGLWLWRRRRPVTAPSTTADGTPGTA